MPPGSALDAYRELLRSLDRLLPGTLAEPARGAAPPPRTAAALVRAAGELARDLPEELGPARLRFLRAQLTAVEWTARRLAGQGLRFPDEVRLTYDARIAPGDEEVYRRAHAALDAVLPGPGDLAGRLRAHRSRDVVPRAALGPAVQAVSDALRARTREVVPLPGDEHVEYRVVDDAPWAALHTHLGGHRSRIAVNAGARPRWGQLVPLVAHEAYPGHHTERCRSADTDRPEQAAVLVTSPQSLVAEGAAELGLEAVAAGGWERLAPGLPFDAATAERVHAARAPLLRARQDAALLLHAHGPGAALAHLRRWWLVDEARARQVLRFLCHPLWRGYTTTYVEGHELVRRWWAADPGPERFLRLLDEPWTPAALRQDLLPPPPGNGRRQAMNGRPSC